MNVQVWILLWRSLTEFKQGGEIPLGYLTFLGKLHCWLDTLVTVQAQA